jgi:hypothetical protein
MLMSSSEPTGITTKLRAKPTASPYRYAHADKRAVAAD